jgi:hypothetical protein
VAFRAASAVRGHEHVTQGFGVRTKPLRCMNIATLAPARSGVTI